MHKELIRIKSFLTEINFTDTGESEIALYARNYGITKGQFEFSYLTLN